jgi:hypothetical protein
MPGGSQFGHIQRVLLTFFHVRAALRQDAPMKPPFRVLPAIVGLLLSANHAWGADYHVVGEVVNAVPALAAYGVTPGAAVDVTWTVDLSTPATSVSPAPDNKSDYHGAVDWVLIQIGTWQAVRLAPAMGQIDQGIVSVADDSGGTLDLLHLSTPGTDNDLVLRGVGGVLVLSLDFYAPDGSASSNQGLDQDPSRYPIGVGSAIGTNGYVTFRFGDGGGGGGGSGDPTARCTAAHLGAAAKLCQARFKCESAFAKDPSKDPLGDRFEACVQKSEAAFSSAYTKALLTAASKGLSCASTAPAVDVRSALGERILVGVLAEVRAIAPAHAPLVTSWLGAAGTACAAGLKAEAKNAAKPDAGALAAARDKASDKLEAAAQKALDKAAGVDFLHPLPDVPGLVEAVDALIDETAADSTGG